MKKELEILKIEQTRDLIRGGNRKIKTRVVKIGKRKKVNISKRLRRNLFKNYGFYLQDS